ncbi:MAG TPA: ATP-binding protein [Kofleriaceae bacterium]|nr:ATP-binding protein [Kofleriaceae bacterium]
MRGAETSIFDLLGDSVACYELDGTIAYANPATATMLERPLDEVIGRRVWELAPAAIDSPFHAAFQRVAKTGVGEHFAMRYEPWQRWFDHHLYLLRGQIWAISRDITEQRLAAARLEILATASRVFSEAVVEAPSMFDAIARHVADVIGDLCSIRLLSADARWFEPPIGLWDPDPGVRAILRDIPPARADEAVGPDVLRMRPVVVTHADPCAIAARLAPTGRRAAVEQLGIHSVIAMPLRAHGRALGLVTLCRRRDRTRAPYNDADVKLLGELADRAAAVVSQSRAYHELARSERELTSERHKLRALIEGAPFAVVVYEGPAHITRLSNPVHDAMTGHRIELGKPLVESLPELSPAVLQILDEVYAIGQSRTMRELHSPLLRDGTLHDCWFDCTWQALPDADGKIHSVLATAVEVTAHVVARRRLEAAHGLQAVITSNASLGLVLMDARQHCTFMNPAAEQITGFRFAEVQGKPLHEFVHHTRPDGTPYPIEECPIDRALPTKNQERGEDVFVHKDGHFYPVAFTASPIVQNGIPVGTVIEVRDTTAEKAAERERERILAELRTSIAARDEFLSIAAHELRTPLTTLELQLDSLQRVWNGGGNGDTEKLRAKTALASRQVERLTALVESLLDVSRIATGRIQLELADVDLAAVVREAIERLEGQAARAGTQVRVTAPASLHGVWDRARLEQVLTNLLTNAIKYGGKQPIDVELHADARDVTLVVRDGGIGISDEDLGRIFGRFERAVSSRHYGGLGLGLYIAHQIVRAHGGSIEVLSTPGHGSTFTVRLPRHASRADEIAAHA